MIIYKTHVLVLKTDDIKGRLLKFRVVYND